MILTIVVVAALVAATWVVAVWLLAYGSTHPWRMRVPDEPGEEDGSPENVAFLTSDGLKLSGWLFMRDGAQAALILCHGHQFNRVQMLDVYRGLRNGPFSFLMFDFRRAGRSEGSISTIGADEVKDLEGAVDFLRSRADTCSLPIGVFGYSMGGAVAIMAAAGDSRIRAVATQGAYASLDRAIADRGTFFLGILGPLLARPSALIGRLWLRHQPNAVAPLAVIGSIAPRPVMICHGEWDPFISLKDARDLYDAAHPPKDLMILPRSWHIGVDRSERTAYYAALRRFFERALCPEREPDGDLRSEPQDRAAENGGS